MSKKLIVVTGGSGKAGRACVDDLLAHGYEVLVVDRVTPPRKVGCRSIVADLTDYGQTIDALSATNKGPTAAHGVVHLAAIPNARVQPNAVTFRNNILTDYNVFEACRRLGIKDVVYASSEMVLGCPYDEPPPYVPIDEEQPPRPENVYALSKVLSETMAEQFCRWDPELKMIGLRFTGVMEPGNYAKFPSFQNDAQRAKANLWGYIDARDAAQAIRLALESPVRGADVFNIASPETVMSRPTSKLLDEIFPGVPRRREFGGNESLASIEHAKRVLGFEPKFSWRDEPVQARSS